MTACLTWLIITLRRKKKPAGREAWPAGFAVRSSGSIYGVPFALDPIAMVPVMIGIGLMEDIGALGLVHVPPGIVMIGEGHIGISYARFRTPAVAIAVAGDQRGGRAGKQQPATQGSGRNGARYEFSGS